MYSILIKSEAKNALSNQEIANKNDNEQNTNEIQSQNSYLTREKLLIAPISAVLGGYAVKTLLDNQKTSYQDANGMEVKQKDLPKYYKTHLIKNTENTQNLKTVQDSRGNEVELNEANYQKCVIDYRESENLIKKDIILEEFMKNSKADQEYADAKFIVETLNNRQEHNHLFIIQFTSDGTTTTQPDQKTFNTTNTNQLSKERFMTWLFEQDFQQYTKTEVDKINQFLKQYTNVQTNQGYYVIKIYNNKTDVIETVPYDDVVVQEKLIKALDPTLEYPSIFKKQITHIFDCIKSTKLNNLSQEAINRKFIYNIVKSDKLIDIVWSRGNSYRKILPEDENEKLENPNMSKKHFIVEILKRMIIRMHQNENQLDFERMNNQILPYIATKNQDTYYIIYTDNITSKNPVLSVYNYELGEIQKNILREIGLDRDLDIALYRDKITMMFSNLLNTPNSCHANLLYLKQNGINSDFIRAVLSALCNANNITINIPPHLQNHDISKDTYKASQFIVECIKLLVNQNLNATEINKILDKIKYHSIHSYSIVLQ